jgi:hypothetical protein
MMINNSANDGKPTADSADRISQDINNLTTGFPHKVSCSMSWPSQKNGQRTLVFNQKVAALNYYYY